MGEFYDKLFIEAMKAQEKYGREVLVCAEESTMRKMDIEQLSELGLEAISNT